MERIVYLTHWRFPSEKTMTPLIMKTCTGFIREGFSAELWVPWRHNPEWEGKDAFSVHAITPQFPLRRIPAIDLLETLGTFGFVLLVATFNLTAFFLLLFGNRKETILYAHDARDVLLPCVLGYRTFVEIHDFYESGQGWVNKLVFSRATGLIVTNTIKQKHLHERYGVPMERMLRQPNAVEYDFFNISMSKDEARARLGLTKEDRIALYTGHLFSWKGVDTLARSAAKLPESVSILFVGGTNEDRVVLQELVAKEQLPRITFRPHEAHERMPLYMRAADVLVLPNTAKEAASKYETSPVKLFEYLSSGTPVVASDLPSIRDIVTDREVRFFTADDPTALAAAITDTMQNTKEARERSSAGQAFAKTMSWESRAKAITGLIMRSSVG